VVQQWQELLMMMPLATWTCLLLVNGKEIYSHDHIYQLRNFIEIVKYNRLILHACIDMWLCRFNFEYWYVLGLFWVENLITIMEFFLVKLV
jgi:hypothetical protein